MKQTKVTLKGCSVALEWVAVRQCWSRARGEGDDRRLDGITN